MKEGGGRGRRKLLATGKEGEAGASIDPSLRRRKWDKGKKTGEEGTSGG
jgi:hypothetical protein